MIKCNFCDTPQRVEQLLIDLLDKQSPVVLLGKTVKASKVTRELFPDLYRENFFTVLNELIWSGKAPREAIKWDLPDRIGAHDGRRETSRALLQ